MEEISQCCLSCLCTRVESNLQEFALTCEPLKAIFQVDKISLCYLCTRLVQHTEMFVQNVQSNQILLENLHGDIPSIRSVRPQVQPSITLTLTHLPTIELTGSGDEELSVFSSRDLRIKLELKEELDHLEGEFIDGSDDFQDSYVKEESYPINNSLLKEEIELDSIDLKSLKKSLKSKKVKKKDSKKEGVKKKLIETPRTYTKVHITEAQCIAERVGRAEGHAYLSSAYRCEPCARGFALLQPYHAHLARHSPSRGEFECNICTMRYDTADKLTAHKQGHTLRYKCLECDLTCASYSTIKEHVSTHHINGYHEFKCPHCPKVYTRAITLRKHKHYRHSGKDKVLCEHCHNTYANKDSLRSHIIRKHSLQSTCASLGKRYCCQECGLAFKAPSQLRNHAATHSDLRPFYCVECDRSFKTAYALSHHLKTAAPHVNYAELPLNCQHCDKRFAIKRDLIRHTNRVHLNIKPYSCDKCERTYINNWSLKEHKRYSHEGVKRPLRYPCSMCEKVFDRNSILKSHARTHTGERPYQCARCPAAFGQSSALGTHTRLVHLKLTRAGRPKANTNT